MIWKKLNPPQLHKMGVAFLRSKSGKSFVAFALLSLLLSGGVGYGFYYSNLEWYLRSKGDEKVTALALVDSFVTDYSAVRAKHLAGDAPVPASFRAHAIERFNQVSKSSEALRMRLVGPPGKEIATPPGDAMTAETIERFARTPNPRPENSFVKTGGEILLRTIYPSLANQQSCVDCHNQMQAGKQTWHLKDVMGAFVVDVPATAFFKKNMLNSVAAGSLVFLVSFGIGLYVSFLHFRQVTVSEAARLSLVRSEERFKDYAETASDWYWETGPDHRYTYMSDHHKDSASSPLSSIGTSRIELAANVGAEAEKWREHIAVLNRREPFRDFTYLKQNDGATPSYIATSGKPLFTADGQFSGYRGTARDVTESVGAAQRLRESIVEAERANRAKSEFLANMSHELRTPLNAVIGFSELILNQSFGPVGHEYYRDYASHIHESGSHLLDIINDILDLAKIESGKFTLSPEPVNLAEVIDSTLRILRPKAEESGLTVQVTVAEELKSIEVDRRAIMQILLNLFSNAIKFTSQGGKVEIAAGAENGGGAAITVADTGIGIAQQDLAKILTPFGQVETAYSRKHQGTGLGLPLVKHLAELHGGRLEIASLIGVGTAVTVHLPAECRSQEFAGDDADELPASLQGRRARAS